MTITRTRLGRPRYGIRRRYAHLTDAERLLERFVRRIEWDGSDCWPVGGPALKGGYRRFKDDKQRNVLAHRWAYQYFKGPIPDGLTVDHVCCREECGNPDHLDAVTMKVNIRRGNGLAGINARKAIAKCGHSFTFTEPDGRRRCAPCLREAQRKRQARHRAKRRAA